MGVEAITGAAATYQATPVTKTTQPKPVEPVAHTEVSENAGSISKDTITIRKKDSAGKQNEQGMEDNNRQQPSEEAVKKAIDDLNKRMGNTECQFGVHEGTNRITIKILDKDTHEVVKELPPEKTLDLIKKAWEMAGLLVDEKL